MTISTRLTELLGIAHPILLAPMDLVSDGRLAAEVSKAGAFGIIGGGYGDEAWLVRELDAAGDARVGVGFITWSMARKPRVLDLVLERKPAAIMLSFGEVGLHAVKIKKTGARLICQVQTLAHVKDAVANGADVIVAQGAEGGGHGISRGTFAFVPAAVDAARGIPVVAAGGVADGRGLAAALMLGADGVLMGTRFYASIEAAGKTRPSNASSPRAATRRSVASCSILSAETSGRRPTLAACCRMSSPGAGLAARRSCSSTKSAKQRDSMRHALRPTTPRPASSPAKWSI